MKALAGTPLVPPAVHELARSKRSPTGPGSTRTVLLLCGIFSSLLLTVLFMLVAIGFGATAFGKSFRLYSIVTIVILFVFGALTGLESPRLQANLPTPWIGLWERISILGFLLWVAVLAVVLIQARDTAAVTGRKGSPAA